MNVIVSRKKSAVRPTDLRSVAILWTTKTRGSEFDRYTELKGTADGQEEEGDDHPSRKINGNGISFLRGIG